MAENTRHRVLKVTSALCEEVLDLGKLPGWQAAAYPTVPRSLQLLFALLANYQAAYSTQVPTILRAIY